MGFQLWTSKVTGYRRRGTRLSDLLSVLGGGAVTQAIWEPLRSAPANMQALEAHQLLSERGYDAAGVQESVDGPVLGYLITKELTTGVVSDHIKPLKAEDLVSDSTPVQDMLAVLRRKERIFVLSGFRVCGILTRADLNKPPVRIHLFGLISLCEMHLQFWIASNYDGDSWEPLLGDKRLEDARKLCNERRLHDEEITLLDCIQFCDKSTVVLSTKDLIGKLGLPAKKKAAVLFGRAERLRNKLAHSQLDLVQGTTWEKLIDLIEAIQKFVHRSDEVIEENARELRERDIGSLWVARSN